MARQGKREEVTLRDVRILFPNFSGKAGPMNNEGNRNFLVLLDPDTATAMIEDGWNIKQLKPREEGDAPQDYVKVKVKFNPDGPNPNIYVITSRGRTRFDESDISALDWAEIVKFDLTITPYVRPGQVGEEMVTAYLKTAFITINEDPLEAEYADVPDSGRNARAYTPVTTNDNFND